MSRDDGVTANKDVTSENHNVGLLEGILAAVAHLNGAVAAKQACAHEAKVETCGTYVRTSAHAPEEARDAESLECGTEGVDIGGREGGLAAQHNHGPLGSAEQSSDRIDLHDEAR